MRTRLTLLSSLIIIVSLLVINALYFTTMNNKYNERLLYKERIYVLSPSPIRITKPYGADNGYHVAQTDMFTFISWTDTNQDIDLDNAANLLQQQGFYIVTVNTTYLEALKRYLLYPHLQNDINAPALTIYTRIYVNGTIMTYTVVSRESLAMLMYMDSSMQYPIPVTMKTLIDILNILQMQQYTEQIYNGIPSLPEARYIGVIWSHNTWRTSVSGIYYINEEVLAGAWIVLFGPSGNAHTYFKVDNYLYYDDYPYDGWVRGALIDQHVAQGSHSVTAYRYSYGIFFLIMLIF